MLTRVLDRYLFREIFGPLVLGLMVFTMMLLTDVLFELAEIIIRRNVPAGVVFEMLLLNLPHIIVLTIPMSFLLAVLISVGRFSADSELVAIRAAGVSLFALYRPVMTWAFLLTACNIWLMNSLLPWGNTRLQELSAQAFAASASRQVEPGQFYDELDDRVLYVARTEGDTWFGVFLADSVLGRQHRITLAASGTVQVNQDTAQAVLSLEDGSVHELDQSTAEDRYSVERFGNSRIAERDEALATRARLQADRSTRSMGTPELLKLSRDPNQPERKRRSALINVHKRLSIPAACIVLGLFGVPLGFTNNRGGRSSGFALSLVVILAYQVLINVGERAAEKGDLAPWLSMWLPNLLFLVAGLFLLARRNADKSLVLGRFDRWIREHLWAHLRVRSRARQRRQYRRREEKHQRRRRTHALRAGRDDGRQADGGGMRLRLPSPPSLRFPNVLDRYLLATFGRVFLMATSAGLMVFVIANFTELIDEVLENDVSFDIIFDYYKYFAFQIFALLSPVVVLITTLVSFGLLSRSNEIIAAKAAGISLFRMAIPILLAAAVLTSFGMLLESSVLPHTNARAAEYKAIIRGEQSVRTFRRADQHWLYGQGGYIYHYQLFDEDRQTLQHLHVFQLNEDGSSLVGRMYAQTATWRDGSWTVQDGWFKRFDGMAVAEQQDLVGPVAVDLPETPEFFATELRPADQMTRSQLAEYVDRLRESGQDATIYAVRLHNKLAGPAAAMVMALVALPFAFRMGRRGALYGIGIALVLGMVYFALNAFFVTLGDAGALPPSVAVWGPNVLFSTASVYLFLGVQT